MASINRALPKIQTHGGATAQRINPELELRRSVMSCLLWENEFYESGETITDRIKKTIPLVDPNHVFNIAIEARTTMNLRHIPLFIAREMARLPIYKGLVGALLPSIILRPDELTEFLAIYWKDGKQPLSGQVKKGLARAFNKFNEYSLAKYNRDNAIKIRDVLFLSHSKPKNEEQEALYKRLIDGTLATPDTWEVEISSSKDKKASWTRLLTEKKLGGLALLRNLRNMKEAKVDMTLVNSSIEAMDTSKVLPFRFISAAVHAPDAEPSIEVAMLKGLSQRPKLTGKTILIVDVSGSMYGAKISAKSKVNRAKTACGLGILIRELCEYPVIYATGGSDSGRVHATVKVPSRRGFALSDAIYNQRVPLGGGGIFLTQVMDYVKKHEESADRIIVITDEQDCDIGNENSPSKADAFGKENYLINVASAKNGIGYGKWTHIDGFSEAIIDYIVEHEKSL